MMVATWDDYEEGTEIETGIDNCIQNYGGVLFQPTISGTTLKWSYSFDESKDLGKLGSPSTVARYDLYYTQDGSNYVALDTTITAHRLAASSTGR
jgi:hypothetical protein